MVSKRPELTSGSEEGGLYQVRVEVAKRATVGEKVVL